MKWKSIPKTNGCYSVSTTGLIRRDKRVNGNCNAGGLIKQRLDRYGYPRVNLSVDGKFKTFSVHRLVALAFLPRKKKQMQINHKDGIKKNNTPKNLEWCSCGYNLRHALALKLRINKPGEGANGSKLKEWQALEIRRLRGTLPQTELAKMFGVSQALIARIHTGKAWAYLIAPEIDRNGR